MVCLGLFACAGDRRAPAEPTHPSSQLISAIEEPLYLVLYRPGPAWPANEPTPSVLREHFRYLLELHRRGALKLAGPFGNERGGAAVLGAADEAAARSIVLGDPAVQSGVFEADVRAWSPVDWQHHADRASR